MRKFKNKFFELTIYTFSGLTILPLLLVLFYLLKKGLMALSLNLFIHLPRPVGVPGGGILNALVGTFLIVFFASIIAIPIGVLAGIYLYEAKGTLFSNLLRYIVEILQSIPSIVLGIIAYLWLVKPVGHFSALSGSVALAIMMLPLIVRSTEENLKLVPQSLKEAAFALGVPHYKTIIKVVLPAAQNGIISGISLAIARISGETAPLLFTAFGNPYLNLNIFKPVDALPLLIFNYATSPYEEWHRLAWGASLILIIFVLAFNILARLRAKKWKPQF